MAVPHWSQNREPAGFAAPQEPQVTSPASVCPHEAQNLALVRLPAPQAGQWVEVELLSIAAV
jgi:hypothetical protein